MNNEQLSNNYSIIQYNDKHPVNINTLRLGEEIGVHGQKEIDERKGVAVVYFSSREGRKEN